jgi:hypothetical protein
MRSWSAWWIWWMSRRVDDAAELIRIFDIAWIG